MLLLAAMACLGLSPAVLEVRAVHLPGSLAREDLVTHLDYVHRLGFNALWVQAHQVTNDPLARTPSLNEAGRVLASWSRRENVRLIVSLDPMIAGSDRFALGDKALVTAIRRFARTLRRDAQVHDLILSFENAAPDLREIRDIVTYGRDAAPAHADLARRVRVKLPRSMRLWLLPARPLDTAALESLAPLPVSIGLVWRGNDATPAPPSATDISHLRDAVGPRAVLIHDRFPANQAGNRMPLAHNLGPLQDRDVHLAGRINGYVSVAMDDWAASRLTLITVADWLRNPPAYEAKTSWERAMRTLAGEDAQALEALRTQALEWGGPPGGRNHHTAATDNPSRTSNVLRDPALVSRWHWTLTRYPQRMKHLQGLADVAFRDELLEVMARRLVIARAIPTAREILARQAAGRSDLAGLIGELNRLRARAGATSSRIALDRFLFASGILPLLDSADDAPARD